MVIFIAAAAAATAAQRQRPMLALAGYELTISNDTDASNGVYESRRAAMDAADSAAAVDGLIARYGRSDSGFFVDADGVAWFSFRIWDV
jgi:hypothetical protein